MKPMYLVGNVNCVRLKFFILSIIARFLVVTVVMFMVQIFWDVTPCLLGVFDI